MFKEVLSFFESFDKSKYFKGYRMDNFIEGYVELRKLKFDDKNIFGYNLSYIDFSEASFKYCIIEKCIFDHCKCSLY